MNHLAHIFLSGNDPEILLGNLLMDFLDWKAIQLLDDRFSKGFELHILIDTFTDQHPMVKQGTTRLHPYFGKYAPVVVDIYYDHLLWNNWSRYSTLPYEDFTNQVYDTLGSMAESIPDSKKNIIKNIVAHRWLDTYSSAKGLDFVFQKLENRTKFLKNFDQAVTVLYEHFEAYNQEFNAFFPELINVIQNKINISIS